MNHLWSNCPAFTQTAENGLEEERDEEERDADEEDSSDEEMGEAAAAAKAKAVAEMIKSSSGGVSAIKPDVQGPFCSSCA